MGADFSRLRDNPLLDFCGVEMQQGKVLLDSDWNEAGALADRRLRAAAMDTMGRAAVPATTPKGFEIALAGGKLTIGAGRMYVDGLLAECHRGRQEAPLVFDEALAESTRQTAIDFDDQPYYTVQEALPTSGQCLAYIDVWRREVGPVENPALVEPAIGVDTTARKQTVWQVRVLKLAAPIVCATPDAKIPEWAAIVTPSPSRLTTGYAAVAPASDPCELPPGSGYRGLENQLYRVEIHQRGGHGAAEFKWSRENASVASRVADYVSPTELELESLGHDDVLSIRKNDWVEVIDDARELSGIAGSPLERHGDLLQVTAINANRVTLSAAIAADLRPPAGTAQQRRDDIAKRNLRVRRWDGKATVPNLDAAGNPQAIAIGQEGVQLTFELDGGAGEFRSNDYWVFAARVADRTIEILKAAPPRGIHHHFARLATYTPGTKPASCRVIWPSSANDDCGCNVCVTPESHASGLMTIQAAVNKVRAKGGTVCLSRGLYRLKAPVAIRDSKGVRIRGMGAATQVYSESSAFSARACAALAIEEMIIITRGKAEPAVLLRNCLDARLQRLSIWVLGKEGRPAIGLSGIVIGASITENFVRAREGVAPFAGKGDPDYVFAAALRIERNALWCVARAVALDGRCILGLASVVAHNEILECADGAVRANAIGLPASHLRIAANHIGALGPGIVAAIRSLEIEGNQIDRMSSKQDGRGIDITKNFDPGGTRQCRIAGNRISGLSGTAVALRSPLGAALVCDNVIEGCAGGILMFDRGGAESITIRGNHVLETIAAKTPGDADATAILATASAAVNIESNVVRGVARATTAVAHRAGIQAIFCNQVRIAGNQVLDVAPPSFTGTAEAIEVVAPFNHVVVCDNQVDRGTSDTKATGSWYGLRVRTPAIKGSAAGWLSGNWIIVALFQRGSLIVQGNSFEGVTEGSVISASVGSECVVSANSVERTNGSANPVVSLSASGTIVTGNRVRGFGLGQAAGLAIAANGAAVTATGNLVSGTIKVDGALLGNPFAPLNLPIL